MNDVRLIDANKLTYHSCGSEFCTDNAHGCGNCDSMEVSKREIDNAPTIDLSQIESVTINELSMEDKVHFMELLKHPKSQVVIRSDENCWIPVSERLPDKNGEYLVTLNILGDRSLEINKYVCGKGWEFYKKKVIAWQPLPDPYKEND